MKNKEILNIVEKYPWIKQEKQKLIISPDSDGFLSALLLINYFDAEVVGYYDCKVMLCDKNVDPKDCIFVDLDIFCKDIKSIGHHMVCYNNEKKPSNWYNYENCIQPNNFRSFDCKNSFHKKYPFATIHFLIALLETIKPIKLAPTAVVPLLFSDGVCNNLFGYPENCIEWLQWLRADNKDSLLYDIFYKEIPFSKVMEHMNDFFEKRDLYNSVCYYDFNTKKKINKKRARSGHHMIISASDGTPLNIVENDQNTYDIFANEKERTLEFIGLIANLMGWQTKPSKWKFSNLKLYKFKKEKMNSSTSKRFNQTNYNNMVENTNCFSMAITAKQTIEYTLDIEGFFRK